MNMILDWCIVALIVVIFVLMIFESLEYELAIGGIQIVFLVSIVLASLFVWHAFRPVQTSFDYFCFYLSGVFCFMMYLRGPKC